ncbi:MAG: AI-2E family transporter, partial [Bacteroidia bacterium]
MSNQIHFNKRTIAYLALNVFGLFIVYLLSDFITPFLGALIFFVLFRKMMNYMVDKKGWKSSTSAILIILLSFIIVLVPVITFSNLLYSKIIQIVSSPETIVGPLKVLDAKFLELTGRQLFSPEMISTMQEKLGQIIPSFISKLFVLLGNVGMMYFMLYYMLVQRDNMQKEV